MVLSIGCSGDWSTSSPPSPTLVFTGLFLTFFPCSSICPAFSSLLNHVFSQRHHHRGQQAQLWLRWSCLDTAVSGTGHPQPLPVLPKPCHLHPIQVNQHPLFWRKKRHEEVITIPYKQYLHICMLFPQIKLAQVQALKQRGCCRGIHVSPALESQIAAMNQKQ